MPYATESIEINKKAYLLSMLHLAASVYLLLPIGYQYNISGDLWRIVLFFGISIPLYLWTGIPNPVEAECQECGRSTLIGRLHCSHCGEPIDESRLGIQIIWFLTGYSIPLLPLVIFSFGMIGFFFLVYFSVFLLITESIRMGYIYTHG